MNLISFDAKVFYVVNLLSFDAKESSKENSRASSRPANPHGGARPVRLC